MGKNYFYSSIIQVFFIITFFIIILSLSFSREDVPVEYYNIGSLDQYVSELDFMNESIYSKIENSRAHAYMLIHRAEKKLNEKNVQKLLKSQGVSIDEAYYIIRELKKAIARAHIENESSLSKVINAMPCQVVGAGAFALPPNNIYLCNKYWNEIQRYNNYTFLGLTILHEAVHLIQPQAIIDKISDTVVLNSRPLNWVEKFPTKWEAIISSLAGFQSEGSYFFVFSDLKNLRDIILRDIYWSQWGYDPLKKDEAINYGTFINHTEISLDFMENMSPPPMNRFFSLPEKKEKTVIRNFGIFCDLRLNELSKVEVSDIDFRSRIRVWFNFVYPTQRYEQNFLVDKKHYKKLGVNLENDVVQAELSCTSIHPAAFENFNERLFDSFPISEVQSLEPLK